MVHSFLGIIRWLRGPVSICRSVDLSCKPLFGFVSSTGTLQLVLSAGLDDSEQT